MKLKRKFINTLEINITEKHLYIILIMVLNYYIINNDLEVLEEVDNIEGRNLVEVKGIDLSAKDDESRVDEFNSYKRFDRIFIHLFIKIEKSNISFKFRYK